MQTLCQFSGTARLNIVLLTIRYLGMNSMKPTKFLGVSFSHFRTIYLDAGRTLHIDRYKPEYDELIDIQIEL